MEKKEWHWQYHFVLVHGDCHGDWCWYKLTTLLRSASHKVTALDLTGEVGESMSIEEYWKPLINVLMEMEGVERVILVGHSRGGYDISMAMERFPHKIAAAVFVTAAMPGPLLDIPTITKQFEGNLSSTMDNEYTYGRGKDKPPTSVLFGPNFLASRLYQLSPTEDLTLATYLMRPSPQYIDFYSPTKETALTQQNYGSVPRVYIVCDQDNAMKEEMQRWLISNNPPDDVKVIKGSDHMAMISKPQELYSYLLEIANKYY